MTTLLALLLAAGAAHAQVPLPPPDSDKKPAKRKKKPAARPGGAFGLGFAIGAPSGLAGKVWMGDRNGLQFTVGGDLGVPGDLAATADYTFHFTPFQTDDEFYKVPLHVGLGMNLSSTRGTDIVLLGPRAVFGATVQVTDLPVDLFFDVAPTLYVAEVFTWSFDGQLGVRYYF